MLPRLGLIEDEESLVSTTFRRMDCFRGRAVRGFRFARCLMVEERKAGIFKDVSDDRLWIEVWVDGSALNSWLGKS